MSTRAYFETRLSAVDEFGEDFIFASISSPHRTTLCINRRLCTKRTKTHKREFVFSQPQSYPPAPTIPGGIGFDPQNRWLYRRLHDSRKESRYLTTPEHLTNDPVNKLCTKRTKIHKREFVFSSRRKSPSSGNRLRSAESLPSRRADSRAPATPSAHPETRDQRTKMHKPNPPHPCHSPAQFKPKTAIYAKMASFRK